MVMDPTNTRSRFLWRGLLRGGVLGLVLALCLHFGYVLLGSNFRTVVPGQVYRCAQPSGAQLQRLIRKYGIRTVINMRGPGIGAPWYTDEANVTSALHVSLEDIGFSAGRLPSPSALRQLVEVLDRSEYPILVHCHQGADRTGLASVVYFLMRTERPLAEARRQLGPASGHLPLGRTRYIDRFFELYEEWLAGQGLEHSPGIFRLWVRDSYCPAEGRGEFTLPDASVCQGVPLRLHTGVPRLVVVRCRNTSIRTWRLQPQVNAGVNGIWFLVDAQDHAVAEGRVGLFDAVVHPGESIDLTIPLPALPVGRFQLRFDLASAQHGSFLQLGNDVLLVDVEVS